MRVRAALTMMAVALVATGCSTQGAGPGIETPSSSTDVNSRDASGGLDSSATTPEGSVTLDATDAFLADGRRIWYLISLEEPDKYSAYTAFVVEDGQVTPYSALAYATPTLIESTTDLGSSREGALLPLSDVARVDDEAAVEILAARNRTRTNPMRTDTLPPNTYPWSGMECRVEVGALQEPVETELRLEEYSEYTGARNQQLLAGWEWPDEVLSEVDTPAYAATSNNMLNICATTEEVLRLAVSDTSSLEPITAVPAVRVDWVNAEDSGGLVITAGLSDPIVVDGVAFGGYPIPTMAGTFAAALVTKVSEPTTFVLDTAPISAK